MLSHCSQTVGASRAPAHTVAALRAEMRSCEQMPGLSVLAHGQSVAGHYRRLCRWLRSLPNSPTPGWRWPSWLITHGQDLLRLQVPAGRAAHYQIYHDCGKPQTRQIDDAGRSHFPGHSEASEFLYRQHFPGRAVEAALIREDMRVHIMPASDLGAFGAVAVDGVVLWPTLLLTALCELHANAALFGGVETASFKAKFSQIERRGKALCKQFLPAVSGES